MNNFFACMWSYISASNSIYSIPSWLRSTFLDSAFPSVGCLGETFHQALGLHFPSYSERNSSENAATCGNQAFHNFQSNLTPLLHSRLFDDFQEILPQAFLSKSDICSSSSSDANILLICGPTNIPPLTFASDILGNICLILRKVRLVGFKALNQLLGQSEFNMQWRKKNFAPFNKRWV